MKNSEKKIIRRPSLLYVLGLEYKKYKKNGITMQPPRMALTTSGGPGYTDNIFMIAQSPDWPFSVTTGPQIKTSGASCSEIVQIFIFSTSSIH